MTNKTQRLYEIGERSPDAVYLAAFAEKGGDVLYVVEGRRVVGTLSDAEAKLVEAWRGASEPVQGAALGALLSEAKSAR